MTGNLYRIAREEGCEILPVRRISEENGRFCGNPPLQFLEKNLFRYRSRTYEQMQDRVQILVGRDPRAEIAFAAGEISRLVRDEGYRYREYVFRKLEPVRIDHRIGKKRKKARR